MSKKYFTGCEVVAKERNVKKIAVAKELNDDEKDDNISKNVIDKATKVKKGVGRRIEKITKRSS